MNTLKTILHSAPVRLACAFFAGMVTLPASAVSVSIDPPAAQFYFGPLTTANPDLSQLLAFPVTQGTHVSGNATANLSLLPSPSVTLSVSGSGFYGAAERYHYAISGPAFPGLGGTVTGTLTTSMSASGSGFFTAAAALTGSDLVLGGGELIPGTGLIVGSTNGVCSGSLCPSGYSTALNNQVLSVNFKPTGDLYLVTAAGVAFGSATATVDPIITLPAGYSLTLSQGAGNSIAAVPEPQTYALMIAGLGLLGVAVRRKNKS